jgi:hypothetical protein
MPKKTFTEEPESIAEGYPVLEPDPAPVPEALPAVVPDSAPLEVIGLDAYLVGKYGARRDIYAGFLSWARAKGLENTRRPLAEWDDELARFTTRVIPSV